MSLDKLPLLHKGPVALLLGGKDIIPLLSENQPGRAQLIVQVVSAAFQLFIYCYKKRKVTQLMNYTTQLKKTIFESVLNLYGLNIIVLGKHISNKLEMSLHFLRFLSGCCNRNPTHVLYHRKQFWKSGGKQTGHCFSWINLDLLHSLLIAYSFFFRQ